MTPPLVIVTAKTIRHSVAHQQSADSLCIDISNSVQANIAGAASIVWRHSTESPIFSRPAVVPENGRIVVASVNGNVRGLSVAGAASDHMIYLE